MKKFDIMDACKASTKDFCETLLYCLEDGEEYKNVFCVEVWLNEDC